MADKNIALMAHLLRRAGFGASRDEIEARPRGARTNKANSRKEWERANTAAPKARSTSRGCPTVLGRNLVAKTRHSNNELRMHSTVSKLPSQVLNL